MESELVQELSRAMLWVGCDALELVDCRKIEDLLARVEAAVKVAEAVYVLDRAPYNSGPGDTEASRKYREAMKEYRALKEASNGKWEANRA